MWKLTLDTRDASTAESMTVILTGAISAACARKDWGPQTERGGARRPPPASRVGQGSRLWRAEQVAIAGTGPVVNNSSEDDMPLDREILEAALIGFKVGERR